MVCVAVGRRVGQSGLLDAVRPERRVKWKLNLYIRREQPVGIVVGIRVDGESVIESQLPILHLG